MKDLIGIKVKVLADGHMFEGVVILDRPDRVMLKGNDGKIFRVVKSHITMFVPEREAVPFSPFQLIFCNNPEIKCPGVQYVVEGEVQNRAMYEAFMKPCPRRCPTCRCGTKGDIRTLSSECLRSVFCGVLFGEYPESGKESKNE